MAIVTLKSNKFLCVLGGTWWQLKWDLLQIFTIYCIDSLNAQTQGFYFNAVPINGVFKFKEGSVHIH